MSPRTLLSPESEFTTLADRSTEGFAKPFGALLRAIVNDDLSARLRARERCAATIGETMTLADLYGRRRVLLEFDYYAKQAQFAASPVVPKVPFTEAFADLLSREPRLAPSADAVAELYNTRHAFALAKSAELEITQAVQRFVSRALENGLPAPKAPAIIQGLGDFTRGYAGTVYRTNLTTAYTAGRFQEAQQPGVRDALPALMRWEIMDSATRAGRKQDNGENHAAVNGLIMATTDSRWSKYAPPAGYGCRGGVRLVPRGELRRRKLLTEAGDVIPYFPAGIENYRPHPRFGQRRPDLFIYGGG